MIAEVNESGARAEAQEPKVVQYASESGHFYDPATGQQIELPPRTRATTAIKRGYVPGATSVTKQLHKEAIQRWMVNRAILFSAKIVRESDDPFVPLNISDDILISETWQLLNADSESITGRGKELHAAIELCAQGKPFDPKWKSHIDAVSSELYKRELVIFDGSAEHSFATSRYGGKIDWHNDEWLLDFKTKPSIIEGKRLAYPEHAQQLAAYDSGLDNDYNDAMLNCRRCANVFIGVEDAQVVFHEWKEKDLLQGWREFDALCNYWWIKHGVK